MSLNHYMRLLKINKRRLTKEQYRILKGQAISGDLIGARKGLIKLLGKEAFHEHS